MHLNSLLLGKAAGGGVICGGETAGKGKDGYLTLALSTFILQLTPTYHFLHGGITDMYSHLSLDLCSY